MLRSLLVLFSLFIVQSLEAQCWKLDSPKAQCVKVLENGDVEVRVSPGTMGPNPKAEFIDRFELEYSLDGSFFNAVASMPVGNKWNFPLTLTHVNANAQLQSGYYRIVGYCDTVTNYALPNSEMVQSILLTHNINAQNHVELSWNYDGVSQNMMMIVNRKSRSATHWDSIRTLPMIIGPMSFTDSTLTQTDTISYQIDFINLDNFCQGSSNVVTFIYKEQEQPNSVWVESQPNFRIWPNPVSDFIQIEMQNLNSIQFVDVLSIDGKQSIRFNGSDLSDGRIQLPSDLQKGMYILRIQTETNVRNIRFLKS